MTEAGIGHDSPLAYTDRFDAWTLDRVANCRELASRCAACRARMDGAG